MIGLSSMSTQHKTKLHNNIFCVLLFLFPLQLQMEIELELELGGRGYFEYVLKKYK